MTEKLLTVKPQTKKQAAIVSEKSIFSHRKALITNFDLAVK